MMRRRRHPLAWRRFVDGRRLMKWSRWGFVNRRREYSRLGRGFVNWRRKYGMLGRRFVNRRRISGPYGGVHFILWLCGVNYQPTPFDVHQPRVCGCVSSYYIHYYTNT